MRCVFLPTDGYAGDVRCDARRGRLWTSCPVDASHAVRLGEAVPGVGRPRRQDDRVSRPADRAWLDQTGQAGHPRRPARTASTCEHVSGERGAQRRRLRPTRVGLFGDRPSRAARRSAVPDRDACRSRSSTSPASRASGRQLVAGELHRLPGRAASRLSSTPSDPGEIASPRHAALPRPAEASDRRRRVERRRAAGSPADAGTRAPPAPAARAARSARDQATWHSTPRPKRSSCHAASIAVRLPERPCDSSELDGVRAAHAERVSARVRARRGSQPSATMADPAACRPGAASSALVSVARAEVDAAAGGRFFSPWLQQHDLGLVLVTVRARRQVARSCCRPAAADDVGRGGRRHPSPWPSLSKTVDDETDERAGRSAGDDGDARTSTSSQLTT